MAGSLSVLFFGSVRLSFLVVSREAVCHQRCAGCVVCVGGCWSFCVIFKFIFGGFWIIIVVKVCWFGFEGGLLGAAWFLEGEGCMCDYVVLPLLNSSFEPGRAREVVEGFVDVDLRNIARAELFYFMGQAEECCEITRGYLSSRVIELKLSACILYGYSNLTLGNVAAAKRGMEGIQSCMKLAMKKKVPEEVYASCLLAGYVGRFCFICLRMGCLLLGSTAGCFLRG